MNSDPDKKKHKDEPEVETEDTEAELAKEYEEWQEEFGKQDEPKRHHKKGHDDASGNEN